MELLCHLSCMKFLLIELKKSQNFILCMVCPVARSLYEIYENRPPNAIDMIRYAVATMMYWAETSPCVVLYLSGLGRV